MIQFCRHRCQLDYCPGQTYIWSKFASNSSSAGWQAFNPERKTAQESGFTRLSIQCSGVIIDAHYNAHVGCCKSVLSSDFEIFCWPGFWCAPFTYLSVSGVLVYTIHIYICFWCTHMSEAAMGKQLMNKQLKDTQRPIVDTDIIKACFRKSGLMCLQYIL